MIMFVFYHRAKERGVNIFDVNDDEEYIEIVELYFTKLYQVKIGVCVFHKSKRIDTIFLYLKNIDVLEIKTF